MITKYNKIQVVRMKEKIIEINQKYVINDFSFTKSKVFRKIKKNEHLSRKLRSENDKNWCKSADFHLLGKSEVIRIND